MGGGFLKADYKSMVKEFGDMGRFDFETERLKIQQTNDIDLFNKVSSRGIKQYKVDISKPMIIYDKSEAVPVGAMIFNSSEFCVPGRQYIIGALNILEEYRRRGYAREAVQGLLDRLAFANIDKVYAVIADDNEPSKKLFESLGFTTSKAKCKECSKYTTYEFDL